MCFLSVLNNPKKFTNEMFNECWRINKDGFGMVIKFKNNKGKIFKTMNKDDALASFTKYREDESVQSIVIHFRMGTGGGVNIENVHPYNVTDNIYLFHNGVNSTYTPTDTKSDTALLAEEIGKLCTNKTTAEELSTNKIIQSALYSTYNKYVLVDANTTSIFNENLGHYLDGNWMSNYNYKIYNYDNYNSYAYDWNTKTRGKAKIKEEEKTINLFDNDTI